MVRWAVTQENATGHECFVPGEIVMRIEPGNSFGVKRMPRGRQRVGIVERADVNSAETPFFAKVGFPGQRRPAGGAKGSFNTGGGVKHSAVVTAKFDLIIGEYRQGRHRRAGMVAAALAMTVQHAVWSGCRREAHSTAHTTA